MDTLSTLKEIFKAIITDNDIDVDAIKPEDSIIEDLGLNSIGIFYLVLAIEEEFSVVLHNVSIEKFKTVKDVIDYIDAN